MTKRSFLAKRSARPSWAVVVIGIFACTERDARAQSSVAPIGSYVAHAVTDPVVGTFHVSGRQSGQPLSGEIVIRPSGDGRLELSGKLDDGRTWTAHATAPSSATPTPEVATGPWTFVPTLGALGDDPPPSRLPTITIRKLADGQVAANVGASPARLTPTRQALIVCGPLWVVDKDRKSEDKSVQELQGEERFFKSVADDTARYFTKKGDESEVIRTDWNGVVQKLLEAEADGKPYDRVVFVSHSGWDGPILGYDPNSAQYSGQTYSNGWNMEGENSQWERVVDAVRRGTTPDAHIYVPVCHGGGSDKFEREDPKNPIYIYADDLARRTGRTVAGPCGRASGENSLRLVKAVEGEGTVAQETRVATGSHARTIEPNERVGPETGFVQALSH